MSQKISTLQITSPILITSSSMNVLNNSLITNSNDFVNYNNNSINNICDSLNQSSLLKQKSFSFSMSKQLARRTIPNSSSLSTSISPSTLYNQVSNTNHIKRQNSTTSTMFGGNFNKTKSSP